MIRGMYLIRDVLDKGMYLMIRDVLDKGVYLIRGCT